MKTILHIGQHKTGTTSTQKYLQSNRDKLLEEKIFVPNELFKIKHASHFILNVYALNLLRFSVKKKEVISKQGWQYLLKLRCKLKNDICKIYQEADQLGCETVLWSNEGLYLLNSEKEYSRLKALFTDHCDSVSVLCCFRDTSYRESYYKPTKRLISKLGYGPSTGIKSYTNPYRWLFDDDRKKDLLSRVFDHCHYFNYDRSDNVSAFIKALGLELDSPSGEYRLNITSEASG